MSDIKIGVSLVQKGNLRDLLRPLVEESARARKAVDRDAKAAAKAQADAAKAAAKAQAAEAKTAAREQQKVLRAAASEREKSARQASNAERRLQQDQYREGLRLKKQEVADAARTAREKQAQVRREQADFTRRLRERQRERERENREILRDVARHERQEARDAKQKESKAAQRRKETTSNAVSTFTGLARAGASAARSAAAGMGYNTDVSSALSRSAQRQATVSDFTVNAATAGGRVATAGELAANDRVITDAGLATKLDFNELAEGANAFVAKAGEDIDILKANLVDLGKIAMATGTDVGDLISAAGDVSKSLEDTPDKAQRLQEVMRLIAKQTAMGNVEMADFAVYMSRVVSSAYMFEGDRAQNMGILGALAQVSMRGGRSTAAEGTNSAQSFARDITKGRALERFQEAGLEVFTDETKTKLRSADKIILDYIDMFGGNLEDLANYFQNENSRAVIKGFQNIYDEAANAAREAGKSDEDVKKAGRGAIQNEFSKFSTTLSMEQIDKSAGLKMRGGKAMAQDFNNRMDMMATNLSQKLAPAFEQLAPKVAGVTGAVADLAAWAANNPMQAVVVAMAASVTKANVGSAISAALEKSAGIGKGMSIAAAALTVIAMGTLVMDSDASAREKAATNTENTITGATNARLGLLAASENLAGKKDDEDKLAAIERKRVATYSLIDEQHALKKRIDSAEIYKEGDGAFYQIGRILNGAANTLTGGLVGTSFEQSAGKAADVANLEQMKATFQANQAALERALSGTLKVEVVSMPGGGPTLGGGRTSE
ncbi:MAG: hypothetical protein ACTHU0_01310 [Kofleriaceae bacterium]